KPTWLLALLTLRANRDVDRRWVAGTLWPESDETKALYNLRENLCELRARLGPYAKRIINPTPQTIRFTVQPEEADVLQFDRDIGDVDARIRRSAVLGWSAPLLEGCGEEWIIPERERRTVAWADAAEELAVGDIESGRFEDAAGLLRCLITVEPLRESAHRRL